MAAGMPAADDHPASLEGKLFTVRRKAARESHIKVDRLLCARCVSRVCTYICPAGVFVWDQARDTLDVRHENCLECGTCRVACEMQAIEWSYPVWGTGISYRRS